MKRNMFFALFFLIYASSMGVTKNIYVSSALYYDNNADGFIDSIIFNYSGMVSDGDIPAFINLLSMPSWRNFAVQGGRLISDKLIEIRVRENRTTPITSVTAQDGFQTQQGTLPGGGEVKANSFMARDHLSPVIVSANLISYNGFIDSLRIVFSEPVNSFSSSEPYNFKVPSGQSYTVSFSGSGLNGNTFNGAVSQEQSGVIKGGDSVWIKPQASVSDPLGNSQLNPANRRVAVTATTVSNSVEFTNAYYYDRDADGFIDSIMVTFTGDLHPEDIDAITGLITLPPERNFTIESVSLSDGGVVLTVREDSSEPRTSVGSDEKIIVRGGLIPGRRIVGEATLSIQDRVAPVLLSAHLETHEVGDDTLLITFSERVAPVSSGQPFIFHNGSGRYAVVLSSVSTIGNEYTGRIISVQQTMSVGDSVWINTGVSTRDLTGNIQNNSLNRRVFLSINNLDVPVEINSAVYFDDNGNGFVDRINLEYSGPVNTGDLQRILELLSLPSARNFTVQSISQHNSSIVLRVNERRSQPRTSVSSDDRIRVNKGRTPGGGFLVSKTLQVIDSVAPVLLSAHLDWYGQSNDILRTVFSEPVKSNFSQRPFLFKLPGGGIYVVLVENSTINGDRFSARVVSVSAENGMQVNDSVWINTEAGISDNPGNIQLNSSNRRVLLTVAAHFNMRVLAENNPFSEGKRPMPKVVLDAYSRNGKQSPPDGLVVIVEPDRALRESLEMEGTISIYDVVHNPVVQKKSMVFDSRKNRLYYVWDGNNYNGRKTGTGTYQAVIKIKDRTGKKITRNLNLGVKR
ncbi:MAG: hypothetical protein GX556_01785 [Fibrobacter sp.]|nr:hypothetical protein [Fibrobacter sp.]